MRQKLFTKNFTLLVLGQITSLFGNMILRFALSMYILDITGSAAIFAGILAVTMIPTIILSPFGGILADRANRRNCMVALDLLSGLTVLGALLLLSDQGALPVVTGILLVLSILGAFESPTVQACVPQMHSGDNVIKANAVVNQVGALSALFAPVLGGVLYGMLGLRPILIITVLCFFLTALLECFIRLPYEKSKEKLTLTQIIRHDLKVSLRFIFKEQPQILKLLLLAALVSFFVMGVAAVGLPFLIRTVLLFSPEHYGVAESVLGVAAIGGSICAGLLTTKLKPHSLYLLLAAAGLAFLPAGVIFLLPVSPFAQYLALVISVAMVQFCAIVFSVFALSLIQQQTPNELLGKVMSYITTITLCAQPLSQVLYGFLFDSLRNQVAWVVIPSALVITVIGLCSKKLFAKLKIAN